jgi:hypothetical protein
MAVVLSIPIQDDEIFKSLRINTKNFHVCIAKPAMET